MRRNTNEFLELLLKDTFFDEENIKDMLKTIVEFYSTNERHRYNEVSHFVDKKIEEGGDVIDYTLNNLKTLLTLLKNHQQDYDNIIKEIYGEIERDNTKILSVQDIIPKLEKLYDHIALEENRVINNSKMINDAKLEIRNEILNNFAETFNEYKQKLDETVNVQNANMISVVGIFAAIIFVFFGGIQSLSNIFSGIFGLEKKEELILPIIAILIIGGVLFNIIFLLLYSISKMTGKNMGRVVNLYYYHSYDVEVCGDDCYKVYCYQTEFRKCYPSEKQAEKCRSRRTFFSKVRVAILNTVKVVFLRFPYLIIINAFIFGTSVLLYFKA